MSNKLPDIPDLQPKRTTCDVCGDERPPHLLMVTAHDLSSEWSLPPRSVIRYVTHCRDRRHCLDHAAERDDWLPGAVESDRPCELCGWICVDCGCCACSGCRKCPGCGRGECDCWCQREIEDFSWCDREDD